MSKYMYFSLNDLLMKQQNMFNTRPEIKYRYIVYSV